MNNANKNKNAGFTLLEVLISVIIFSIVVTTLFATFKTFIVSSESVKDDVTWGENISVFFNRINEDLLTLYILQTPRYKKPEFNSDPDPYRFIGKEISTGQDTVSIMSFTSNAHARIGTAQRPGIARISYYLKKNENNSYDFYRADSLAPFPEAIESCSDPVLIKGISEVEVIYMDSNGESHQYWDSDAKEFDYMVPKSINFKISFDLKEREQIFETDIGLVPERPPIE